EQQSRDEDTWLALPTLSAFSEAEIRAVRDWVQVGGKLLLIADHMPFAGAVADLAAAFGVHYTNGYVFNQKTVDRKDFDGTLVFQRADGSLADHGIVRGRFAAELVDAVATFVGSAFRGGKERRLLLTLSESMAALRPRNRNGSHWRRHLFQWAAGIKGASCK